MIIQLKDNDNTYSFYFNPDEATRLLDFLELNNMTMLELLDLIFRSGLKILKIVQDKKGVNVMSNKHKNYYKKAAKGTECVNAGSFCRVCTVPDCKQRVHEETTGD